MFRDRFRRQIGPISHHFALGTAVWKGTACKKFCGSTGQRTLMDRQLPLGAAIAIVLALLLSAPEGASAQIAVSANDNKVLLATESARFPETLSRTPSR
jgi:hypothetical protein